MGAQETPNDDNSLHMIIQRSSAHTSSPSILMSASTNGGYSPIEKVKGNLPYIAPLPSTATTPTGTSSTAGLSTPNSAETRSLPGHLTQQHRQPAAGNLNSKSNGSSNISESLSSFRSTSTMSSGSITSNLSQLCEKYFIKPLIRSRSLPANITEHSSTEQNGRKLPYVHRRRGKGKCMKKFCMRFLPPAAACSGALALQFNIIALRNHGTLTPGTGDKPVLPLGFSKGYDGPERYRHLNVSKLQKLREVVKTSQPELPPQYQFFICHTEEDYIPYVDKLVKKCEKENISVFSRSFSLLWGDSQRIDSEFAIASAIYGIVLLSPALLKSYRNSWCEKDLDVLFDRSITKDVHRNILLPIYCGGITKEQVQRKYPFIASHMAVVYEDVKVIGIVKQMHRVIDRYEKQLKHMSQQRIPNIPKEPLGPVSEQEITLNVRGEGLTSVCTERPTTLPLDGGNRAVQQAAATTPSSVVRAESVYRSDGVQNHCCHCGPMSSKYKNATRCMPSDTYKEAMQMEDLHRSEMAGDSEDEGSVNSGDRSSTAAGDDDDDDDDEWLNNPAVLNERLPMALSTIPHDLLRYLSILMDPQVTIGSDFTDFAAEIGFCNTYIRFLKALNIKTNSPFETILFQWQDNAPDTTIGDLIYILYLIKRHDAVHKIREVYKI